MLAIIGIFLISLAIGFLVTWLEKRKLFGDWYDLGGNLIASGIIGIFAGLAISSIIGACFIPRQIVIKETKFLERVLVNNKKVFLIENKETKQLFYFLSDGEDGQESGFHSLPIHNISYDGSGVRRIEYCEESFINKKLENVFLSGKSSYSRLILSDKGDIF